MVNQFGMRRLKVYKLKQEYLMFASCDNTDEDIYEHFESIAEDMKLVWNEEIKSV